MKPAQITNPKDGHDVFILGAGFSKAISRIMPTLDELGQKIRQESRGQDGPGYDMAKWCNNVELWMTDMLHAQPFCLIWSTAAKRSGSGRARPLGESFRSARTKQQRWQPLHGSVN